MYNFYYSDPHFAHRNIIEYCDRPFESVEHQIEEFIRRYNEKVGVDDLVLWLGDCFFGKSDTNILSRLNGRKELLRGNHDKCWTDTKFVKCGFEKVHRESFVDVIEEFSVRYSHYPYVGATSDVRYLDRRLLREEGVTLIHGHTHSKEKFSLQAVHVGVDAWDYAPASKTEVLELLKNNR